MYTEDEASQESVARAESSSPTQFSSSRKALIVSIGLIVVFNSNLGSSLPSGATAEIALDFHVTKGPQLVLLNSLYIVGYAIGPLLFGPMSEHVGRRPVLVASHICYILFTMGCALSPKYSILLLFRTLGGLVASAPNVAVGGLFADIYDNPTQRGRAMAIFIAVALMGPPLGPLISGCTSNISWRLCFWIGVAIAGAGLPLVLLLPETYEGILNRKADHGQHGTSRVLFTPPHKGELKVVFSRPFTMLWKEPMVLFMSLYLALVYSILYLFFQAYPIIFGGIYSLSSREIGMAFLPVSAGAVIALIQFVIFDVVWGRAKAQKAAWASDDKYARLPLACVGGPL
ncbi:hypothetical protein BHE90_001283 [Fusarium euwallaceae]|uniref:Major facilitator superfamily (MFS) profile domain-containing protein n=1 Tax=Fusarium euwallaceae TaxID=1147111 RepID=A0A430M862_9HYPO|nr:hypothetical protein BHE90_001283 [Fusarium euwallaceae]